MTHFREPITLDLVLRSLDKVPFSKPFVVILPILALLWERRGQSLSSALLKLPSLSEWSTLLTMRHKWVFRMVVFIVLKELSKVCSRSASNLGVSKPDRPKWKKDVVVITGGSTGIGRDVVQHLSRKFGARIAVLDITEPTYAPAKYGAPDILYVRTDVTNKDEVAVAHSKIKDHFGNSPSIVVSCAGVALAGPILTTSSRTFSRTFDINALANVILAHEFLPYMVENNHGHFMVVASSASYFSLPLLGPYSMSKSAALAFYETLRAELRSVYKAHRVRTSVVTPTKVRTLLGHALKDSDNNFLTPVLEPIQVASAMVDTLDSGLGRAISQPMFTSLLPYVRALPEWFRGLLTTVGNTDSSVTAESIANSFKAGYGKNWNKDDFANVFGEMESMVRAFAKKKKKKKQTNKHTLTCVV